MKFHHVPAKHSRIRWYRSSYIGLSGSALNADVEMHTSANSFSPCKLIEACEPRVAISLLVLLVCSIAHAQAPKTQSKAQGAITVSESLSSTNGSASGQSTATSPAAATSLAALPAPIPPELLRAIDIPAQAQAILAHLNEIIRFYRLTAAPIQRVGELSDSLYAQQAQTQATAAGQLAFKSARGQAAFLARARANQGGDIADTSREAREVRLDTEAAAKRLAALQLQQAVLQGQLQTTAKNQQDLLQSRRTDVEGQLKVNKAMFDALSKLTASPNGQQTELQGHIDQLQHSVPELVDDKVKPVSTTIQSIGSVQEKGVTSQATLLIQLYGTQNAINEQIDDTEVLDRQAIALRAPLIQILQATLEASSTLQDEPSNTTISLREKQKKYVELADTFTALSDVAVPISQEILLLEQAKANLVSWRSAVGAERRSILHALVVRLLIIGFALGILFSVGEIWRRSAIRYVPDVRRRRQILLIRRMVLGFLTLIVLTLGFVTQFSSLATFAGFITAGIAVGLQTILLSVAAYFFIVGRFGVKVGERITVSNVTGDVVDVGLARFYLMELTGTGTDLHATGRIAVFANSVLFQTGTPIYKQIPGTEYVWHELIYKLRPDVDHRPAARALVDAVGAIVDTYRGKLENQHKQVERWMDIALEPPRVESRLQLTNGLEYAVLYPVQIGEAAKIDEQIVQSVMSVIAKDTGLGDIVDGLPSIHAVIKS